MSSSEALLFKALSAYFMKSARHRDVLYKIVMGQYSISLRVIDWFITHYSKAMNILYWIDEGKNTIVEQMPSNGGNSFKKFHLYYEYRAQLKSYTKMHFDPFRRHERINFVLDTKVAAGTAPRVIETTVGQLNFFRWALQNHVIEYIHQYLPQIEGHMSMHQTKKTDKKVDKKTVNGAGDAAAATAATSKSKAGAAKPTCKKKEIAKRPNAVLQSCRLRFD